jgi:hypothetical protein
MPIAAKRLKIHKKSIERQESSIESHQPSVLVP